MAFWAENYCADLKNVAGLTQLDAGVTTSRRHMPGRICNETCSVWQSSGKSQSFAVSGRGAAGGDSSAGEHYIELGAEIGQVLLIVLVGHSEGAWHHGGTCQ